LTNLALALVLLFWPSGDGTNQAFSETPRKPDRPSRADATSVTAARIARVTGAEAERGAF